MQKITDEYLYHKCGYNILKFRKTRPIYRDVKNFDYTAVNLDDREFIIEWAKKNLAPIQDEKQEIIPRDQWDLQGLIGEKIEQLKHPHFDLAKDYIFKNYKPNHKAAVLILCSNKKPYSDNARIKYYRKVSKDKADFFIVSNPGIIPIEYDNCYPFRWYEWNEEKEKPDIKKLYTEVTKDRIEEFFNHFKQYETIVNLVRPGETMSGLLTAKIPQKILNVFSPANMKTIEDAYPHLQVNNSMKGLFKTRLLSLKETSKTFTNYLETL